MLPLVTDISRHCDRHENICDLIAAGEATRVRRAIGADVRYAETLLERSLLGLGPAAPAGSKPKTKRAPAKRARIGSAEKLLGPAIKSKRR